MVVPIAKDIEIVFVKQYKHGAGNIIIELPVGRIGVGHDPKMVAINELEEETAYHVEDVKHLGTIFGEPSKDTFRIFGYIALDLHNKHKQELDDNEDIEVILIPARNVDKEIKKGFICASDTISFIKIAQLKYPELFK